MATADLANPTCFILDARTAVPHFPGIGRYVRSLASALAGLLDAHEQLTLLQDLTDDERFTLDNPRVDVAGASASPFGLRQQWRIPPLLAGAAVYHSPYYLMPYRPGVPTVLTVYDLIPQLFPGSVPLRGRLVFMLTTRLALRAADHVIAISEATRRDFLALFPRLEPARITAVPLAPAPHFRPQPAAEIERVRKLFSLPDQFALYVGINKPHKNLVRLIEAWGLVKTALPLVIAGTWDARYPEASEAAGRLPAGRVRFIGRVLDADLPALYSACRLFVFPSLAEGFGLPVVEALACGAAVACSNASSLPEVGGDAAAYFDPVDVRAMAASMADALRRPPDAERSIRQAAGFSWERNAARTLEIYRAVARLRD